MKKLNKKGFTLVELLAVIVILAVIMVITIPTVLGSMGTAKQEAFEAALKTIEEYAEKNIQVCEAGLDTLSVTYDTTAIKKSGSDCTLAALDTALDATGKTNALKTLVKNAGYEGSVTITDISENNGVVTISKASGSGEFNGTSIGS